MDLTHIEFILFFVLHWKYGEGVQCHICAGEQACQVIIAQTPEWSGRCDVEAGQGKCFIRRDPNNALYWGCIDDVFWPGVPWRAYNGCSEDLLHGWIYQDRKRPIVWCFCEEDDCNVSIERLNTTVKAPSSTTPSLPVTPPSSTCITNGKPQCHQLCDVIDDRVQCSCTLGYILADDDKSCFDVNECSINNGGCDHLCENTEGSYLCHCDRGYSESSDGHSCTDVDECVEGGGGGCEDTCLNTPGSYRCLCTAGLELLPNGAQCRDINECAAHNGGCDQLCINVYASYQCQCRPGYTLGADNHSCHIVVAPVVDSCETTDGARGPCDQLCEDTVQGPACSCLPGYELDADLTSCSDLDECIEGNAGCSHVCRNTPGSFTCMCEPGFILDTNGKTCNVQCPVDFLLASESTSCYHVVTPLDKEDAQSWSKADLVCQKTHPRAHLVTIETDEEKTYLASLLKSQPQMVEGWQGWWTSGRYISDDNYFVWNTLNDTAVIDASSQHWGFHKFPEKNTCVWIMQIPQYNYTWGNYDCRTRTGYICEIEL